MYETEAMRFLAQSLTDFTSTFGGFHSRSDLTGSLSSFNQNAQELAQALNGHTAALELERKSRAEYTEALRQHTTALNNHQSALYEHTQQMRQMPR